MTDTYGNRMRIRLRLDAVNPEHIHQTLFIDGQNCGSLVMGHGGYQVFGALLLLGADHAPKAVASLTIDEIAHDEHGDFKMPENKQ